MIKCYLLVKCVNATDNARTDSCLDTKRQNYIIATITNFVLSFRSSTNNTLY